MSKSYELYTINKNVKCTKCGNIGAIELYGKYYPHGNSKINEIYPWKDAKTPHMSHAVGFGGTIPHECMNCGNKGLIDFGGLEGYSMAFETIKKD